MEKGIVQSNLLLPGSSTASKCTGFPKGSRSVFLSPSFFSRRSVKLWGMYLEGFFYFCCCCCLVNWLLFFWKVFVFVFFSSCSFFKGAFSLERLGKMSFPNVLDLWSMFFWFNPHEVVWVWMLFGSKQIHRC